MRVAVAGAAGKTGRAVTRALRQNGIGVRALVRNGSRARAAGELARVETAAVDLTTEAGLTEALTGCDGLYLMAPNLHPNEVGLVGTALEAARRAGVERVVYHSVAQPLAPAMPHHVDKAYAEDVVRRSGLTWTVLQPCAYFQNLVPSLLLDPPALRVPYSVHALFGLVDLDDVAAAAAVVLTGNRHAGATYELGGPALVSVTDVARAASDLLGHAVPVEAVDPHLWVAAAGATLDAVQRERLLAMVTYYDMHGLSCGPGPLEWLLARPSTTVRSVLTRELRVV